MLKWREFKACNMMAVVEQKLGRKMAEVESEFELSSTSSKFGEEIW
jgi:hypothetical protein